MDHFVISVLFSLCLLARLFIDALWSPAGKGLTSWLSFVVSNCEVVTFPLVSLVRVVLDCIDSRYLPLFLFWYLVPILSRKALKYCKIPCTIQGVALGNILFAKL